MFAGAPAIHAALTVKVAVPLAVSEGTWKFRNTRGRFCDSIPGPGGPMDLRALQAQFRGEILTPGRRV
jgi:hypothetical protein